MLERHGGLVVACQGTISNLRELGERHLQCSKVTPGQLLAHTISKGWNALPPKLAELHGRFAAIIWDSQNHQLICVRDKLGLVPMSWLEAEGRGRVVSTRAQTAVSLSGTTPVASRDYLKHFLTRRLNDNKPRCGPLMGVSRICPREVMLWSEGRRPQFVVYWRPETSYREPRETDAEDLRSLLIQSLKEGGQRADCVIPSLSGGLDSTAVTEAYATLQEATFEQPIECVSMISRRFPRLDEARWITRVEDSLPIHVNRWLIDDFWTLAPGVLPGQPELADGPVGFPSLYWMVPFLCWARSTTGCSSFATGDGADVVQRSSSHIVAERLIRRRKWLGLANEAVGAGIQPMMHAMVRQVCDPLGITADVRQLLQWWRHKYPQSADDRPWTSPSWVHESRGFEPPRISRSTSCTLGEQKLNSLKSWNLELASRLFRQISRRAGVWLEFPYFDTRLWDWMLRQAPEQLKRHGVEKHLQRRALEGRLPPDVVFRRKSTLFDNMIDYGLGVKAVSFAEELFRNGSHLEARQLIDAKKFLRVYSAYQAHVREHFPHILWVGSQLIWRTIAAEMWLRALGGETSTRLETRL